MTIDARDLARHVVIEHTEGIESTAVRDAIQEAMDDEGLTDVPQRLLVREVTDLASKAMVTVTLPGDPVCSECGGTGQPAEPGDDDGTPKDFAAWESGRDDALHAAETALEKLREEGETDIRSAIHAVRAAIENLGGEQ